MLNSCPTQEAVEYLRVEWKKYEMKCRDIEVGTTILLELELKVVECIMAGVEEQSKDYSKLSSNMGRILTNLTKIQHDNPQPPRKQEPEKEIERLMKGKCYRCGEGHQTDQCSQKGSCLKCTACNRKGHVAKACYTEMLKKSWTVKTNLVSAAAPGTPALMYKETTPSTEISNWLFLRTAPSS